MLSALIHKYSKYFLLFATGLSVAQGWSVWVLLELSYQLGPIDETTVAPSVHSWLLQIHSWVLKKFLLCSS